MKIQLLILSIAASLLLFAGCRSANNRTHAEDEPDGHALTHDSAHDPEEADQAHNHSDEISFTREQAEDAGLETETIVPGLFSQVIKTSGQILSSQGDETAVVATSNGIVSFAGNAIADGTPVKAGHPLVTISAGKLLDGDPATKAKITFETAQKEVQRAEQLVKDQIISTKEFEQIQARFQTARAAYDAQAANVSPDGVRVTSPISGFIKSLAVNQGDYVSVGQIICTVSQNRKLQLRAEVSERYFKNLKHITGANFQTSYDNATHKLSELNGRLLSFGKTSGGQSLYIPVTFEFDNAGDIFPGAYATVYLLSAPQNNILSVPISAVTEEQGVYFVYRREHEESYAKQEVALGEDDGLRVRVLSGLNPGDVVATKGVYRVKLAANTPAIPDGHNHNH